MIDCHPCKSRVTDIAILHTVIFKRNKQHPKTFTLFFTQMFMMYFMRFSQTDQIFVIRVLEPLKTLVNQDIMNHKIAKSIEHNSESNEKQVIHTTLHAKIEKYDTWQSKNHEKYIISFKNISIFGLMVIGVKIPHQTVHHILMGQPGHTFHKKKNT